MADLVAGGAMGLYEVMKEVVIKTAMFGPLLKELDFTIDSLKPLIEDMDKYNKDLDRPEKELQEFKVQMEKAPELIRKCANLSKWQSYKKYKYTNQLLELQNSLQKLQRLLSVQQARDVKQTLSVTKNIETVVLRIDGEGPAGWKEGINDMKEKLLEEVKMTRVQRIDQKGEVQSQIDSEVPASPKVTVGLDVPLTELKMKLLKDDEVTMLVLTAPGGSGKTTLATKFCQDEDVKGIKHLLAWEARSSSDFPSRSRLHSTLKAAVSEPTVATEPAAVKTGGGGGRGRGIRGLWPPPVVLKSLPPPLPQQPINSPVSAGDVTSSDEEPVTSANGGSRSEMRLGKGIDLAESVSCGSSPSNNDSDDYGVGMAVRVRPIHSIFSPNGKFRRSVSSSWQRGQLLGSGSYGTVYEGFTDDGFFFAVKEVSLLDQGPQGKLSLLQLEQEIHLLSQFEHGNIVQYLGTDKDETKLYIFLELVTKGSLANLYSKYLLRDSQVSVFTRQILSGLIYLHDRNVLHRDIKCANILVDASGSVKLADFGLAKATKFNDVKSCKGSAYWMAPEVVNRRTGGYGLAADIWSLGCVVLEMLTRQPPYSHLEGMQALFQIGSGQPPVVPDSLSRDARDFILKCLQINPNNRPTAAQLLNHSFLKRPQTSSVPASPHSNSMRS